MQFLFAALAVFWILRLLQIWIGAPGWLWQILQPVLAVPMLLPWNGPWYAPLAVAGIVAFLQFAENLLIAKADEAVAAIMRRR